MRRGPLYEKGFRPQFSGHETFPLRYGWLKKVFDSVTATTRLPNNKAVFLADDAIANFGVGKNMVTSMRYWALATGVISDESNGSFKGPFRTTPVAREIFSESGWDPYLEEPASLWWLHWKLASVPQPATTIYYVFNHFGGASFYREQLLIELQRYTDDVGLHDLAKFTLKRDVDCFIRNYVARTDDSEEEALESVLSELSLVRPIGRRDGFIIARGPRPSLPDGVFWYALVDFAQRRGARSYTVETLAYEPGSPGRVFLLNEDALTERLGALEELTKGRMAWSETAGLRQVLFREDPAEQDLVHILALAYGRRSLGSGKLRTANDPR